MKSPVLLAAVCLTLLIVMLVTLPAGAVRAQGSADLSLEQQVQAALANAGFDPGPVDGKYGPKTRGGDSGVAAGKRARRDRIPDSKPAQVNPYGGDDRTGSD